MSNWVRKAYIKDGKRPGTTAAEAAELREARKEDPDPRAGERDLAPGGHQSGSRQPLKMTSPPVVDLAAQGIPVVRTCRVSGFSKQALHAWQANPIGQQDWDDAHLVNATVDVHADEPAFGYRLIHDELTLAQGGSWVLREWPGCDGNTRPSG